MGELAGLRSSDAGYPRALWPHCGEAAPSAPRDSSGNTRAHKRRSTHDTTTAASAHRAGPVGTRHAALARHISCTLASTRGCRHLSLARIVPPVGTGVPALLPRGDPEFRPPACMAAALILW